MSHAARLVADIGGTHARFALLDEHGNPHRTHKLAVADYAGPVEAIAAYLDMVGQFRLEYAALAVAAPVDGDPVHLTNGGWTFARERILARFELRKLLLLNDFTALALALPHLANDDLGQIGGGTPQPDAPKAVLGPGTGLGVSGLLPDHGRWLPLSGEGGHVSLAAADAREASILELARRELGGVSQHVSAERLISGGGLSFLHRLVAAVDGFAYKTLRGEEIVDRALAGDTPCHSVVDTFCAMLGTLAGNLALTLGARGGVYIGGGIVPRLGALFDQSPFRMRFEAKGRFSGYLAAIPTYAILAATPALVGAASALLASDDGEPTSLG